MSSERLCAECRKPCDESRPMPFDVYACSELCEWALSAYLDGCPIAEVHLALAEFRRNPESWRQAKEVCGWQPSHRGGKPEGE